MVQYIPGEIVSNILRRLPEESQVRFKIVCKEWRSIINDMLKLDMLFIYPYPLNSPHQRPCAIPLCSLSKTSTTRSSCSYTIHAKNIDVDFNHHNFFVRPAHCHGFLLLYNFNFTNFALWSPFSGERKELPRIGCYYGLGYDLKSNDHKLVASQYGDSEAFIYSLKSQAWHDIGDFPKLHVPSYTSPVFANDALYWLARQGRQKVVISLHLSTETFSELPHPPCCRSPRNCTHLHRLYALEGCLFLLCTRCHSKWYKLSEWNLWIWKDCKTENGNDWNKLITLGKKNIRGPLSYRNLIDPVAYVKSKEQVVIRHDEKFMWFDLKNNKCLKTVTIEGIGSASCQVLPASHG